MHASHPVSLQIFGCVLHMDQHQVACKQHRDGGHVDVMHRRCGAQGCSRAPSFSSVIKHNQPAP